MRIEKFFLPSFPPNSLDLLSIHNRRDSSSRASKKFLQDSREQSPTVIEYLFWHTHSIRCWCSVEKGIWKNKSRRRRFQESFSPLPFSTLIFHLFEIRKKNIYKQQIGKCVFPFCHSTLRFQSFAPLPCVVLPFPAPATHHFEPECL